MGFIPLISVYRIAILWGNFKLTYSELSPIDLSSAFSTISRQLQIYTGLGAGLQLTTRSLFRCLWKYTETCEGGARGRTSARLRVPLCVSNTLSWTLAQGTLLPTWTTPVQALTKERIACVKRDRLLQLLFVCVLVYQFHYTSKNSCVMYEQGKQEDLWVLSTAVSGSFSPPQTECPRAESFTHLPPSLGGFSVLLESTPLFVELISYIRAPCRRNPL